MVHCAAGLHRTGFLAYSLLRVCGFDRYSAVEGIKTMRVATFEKCGQSRFDIAETLVNELLSEINVLHCKETQLENGFLWLFLSINYEFRVEFSCLATDCRLTQRLAGVSGVLRISGDEIIEQEGQQWLELQS